MQDFSPLVASDFLAKVKRPRYKFEIYVGAAWVNLCDLNGVYYLKTISVNPSGAGATADVIAGTWSAEIANPGGIFHPLHPTSDYADYFRIGREVRISIGGNLGGADRYYQRLVGYMDAPKFNHKSRSVSLSGCDYSKQLADTALRSPDNFWGESQTLSSVATTAVTGSEQYTHLDALCIPSDTDDMPDWTTDHATVVSVEDAGGGSTYLGSFSKTAGYDSIFAYHSDAALAVTVGSIYRVSFNYHIVTGSANATAEIIVYDAAANQMGTSGPLTATIWTAKTFYFTASSSCNAGVKLILTDAGAATEIWVDLLSFKKVTSFSNTRYVLNAACNGVYYVTLDGVPLWYGGKERGWFWDEANNLFYFGDDAMLESGTNNLVVYYFTTQDIMDVLGDVLSSSGLYADRAAALAALDYTDPAISLDKVWFEPGTPRLAATKQICERANYRFWFAYDGTPTFKPASVAGTPAFAFPSFGDLSALDDKQDLGQIRNRIVIEGIERGAFSTAKDKQTSRFTGTASDQPSIDDYLEHTETIQNHLFQDQATIDAMCATLLAERKDPKWYATLNVPNPVPLEVGDTISWFVELSHGTGDLGDE